jgi:hypothetical protein
MSKKINLGKWAADTSAAVSFSLAVGTANEMLIAGLTPEQCLKSRAISTCNNLLLGRPYGWYRDRIYKVLKCDQESSHLKRVLANTTSFATFWAPIYAGVLYATGADSEQIEKGYLTATAMSTFIGAPYGYYLDNVRRLFRVKTDERREDDDKNNTERP